MSDSGESRDKDWLFYENAIKKNDNYKITKKLLRQHRNAFDYGWICCMGYVTADLIRLGHPELAVKINDNSYEWRNWDNQDWVEDE